MSAPPRRLSAPNVEELQRLYEHEQLRFFGEHRALADAAAFASWMAPLRKCEWVVYAKRPFAGPEAVLAYLSRSAHRVAISNSRLISMNEHGVTFRWKDYRAKGTTRHKVMTLSPQEFKKNVFWRRIVERIDKHTAGSERERQRGTGA